MKVSALLGFLVCLFWSASSGAQPVADANAALAIVFAHVPHAKAESFDHWKASFNVSLIRGVWTVGGKSWGPTTGACIYYVRASDGQYLGGGYQD